MTPAFVVPHVATTANSRWRSSADEAVDGRAERVAGEPAAVVGGRRTTTSASIARAAWATDEWAPLDATSSPRRAVVDAAGPLRATASGRPSARSRLPAVPPLTNTPPAAAGSPARSAIQRSASFSANTAPPPSSHDPP